MDFRGLARQDEVPKFRSDQYAAELGGTSAGPRLGLAAVLESAVSAYVGEVVFGRCVPDYGDTLAGELEWEGVADRLGYPVAGLPDDGAKVGNQGQVVPVAKILRMSKR